MTGGVLSSDHLNCLIMTGWGSLIRPSELPDHDGVSFLSSDHLACLIITGVLSSVYLKSSVVLEMITWFGSEPNYSARFQ